MKYIYYFSFFVLLFFSCKEQKKEAVIETKIPEEKATSQNFYVGTYTDGDSEGIYQYALHDNGTLEKIGLSVKSQNPSFLAFTKDRKFLLAVNEIDDYGTGTISSYAINKDSLLFVNKQISGGAHPCFVSVNNNGNVLSANYTGGNVGLLQVNANGELSGPYATQNHSGNLKTDEQNNPHAHSAWFVPNSDTEIISVDLGTNQLWFSTLNNKMRTLKLSEKAPTLDLPKGAGPRHLSFHPNGKWVYVVNELNATVSLIHKLEEDYKLINSYTTLPRDFKAESFCADIHISANGEFLYASNRGHNSIVIFKVDKNDGNLTAVGHESVHGEWPRNFAISPDGKFLLVANQHTNNIVSFKRDTKTGLLEYISEIEAPTPVCILF